MAEIQHVLNHLMNRELHDASNYATRLTIRLRVLLKLAKMLDVSLQMIYDTKNSIRVDITCSGFIEKLWRNHYNHFRCGRNVANGGVTTTNSVISTTSNNSSNNNPNSSPTSDEWATLERFLAKDFVRNVDLIRLTAVLKRRLLEKDLNFVFAVDGLYHLENEPKKENDENMITHHNNINDYRNYFENLSVPIEIDPKSVHTDDCSDDDEPINWIHVKAIRAIYKKYVDQNSVTPEKIGKVLKRIFVDVIGDGDSLKNIVDCTKPDCAKTDSENSDGSSDSEREREEDKVDVIEKNIETLYRSIVGNKLRNIAVWKKSEIERVATKEIYRKRKNNSNDNVNERRNKPGRPPRKMKRFSISENEDDSEISRPPQKMKRYSISENEDDSEVIRPPRKIKRSIENDK